MRRVPGTACTGVVRHVTAQGWFAMRRVPLIWDFADECLSAHTTCIIVLPPDLRTAVQNPDPEPRRPGGHGAHMGTPPIPFYCAPNCIATLRSLIVTLFY